MAKRLMAEYQILLSDGGYGKIKTKLEPLDNFYIAEEYHQDYLKKNPNGYCPDLSTGIVFSNKQKDFLDNSNLLLGKQILILEAQSYCPYCEKLKIDVVDDYKGSIPLSFRTSDQLHGLKIESPTWATPSVIFLENGKEVFAYQGYIEKKDFYRILGKFKLGNTEAYDVAFNKGTDSRFCKEYQIFKNTPDGIFIDKLSGEPLFDTKDRFVSRSGWLSFTKPVDGSVYELADNSYGMRRVEIRSTSSDIHLGHVFDDGPNGMPRYCINATVLEFKSREEIS
jgi:peptide methionine sulfoxide reductase msrA/msrB